MEVVGAIRIVLVLALGVVVLSLVSDPVEHRQKREPITREDIQYIHLALLAVIIVSIIIVAINFVEDKLCS